MPRNTKIAILTTARSDFGPLKRVISNAASRFDLVLLVAGSHFLNSRGRTFQEIDREFGSDPRIEIVRLDAMLEDASADGQVRTLASMQTLASRWFMSNQCDLLLFLGDRWELFGVTIPAFMHGIPLAHISGGEITEGVIDDCVRHAHTKLAGLHFAATNEYARNLSQMGEEGWRISVVGECGLDQIHDSKLASAQEILDQFGIDLSRDSILVTFHPSTLDYQTPVPAQIEFLLTELSAFDNYQIIFTAPGVEQEAEVVLEAIQQFVATHSNAVFVEHFGSRNYLAVMKSSKVVVGNSSSGLIEASSLGVPAINVGFRQKNRLSADSVQHVSYSHDEFRVAIERALSDEFQEYARACPNPYDPFRDGKNSLRIVEALEHALSELPRETLRIKKFDTQVNPQDWNQLLKSRA